jgi:hypothetical protein
MKTFTSFISENYKNFIGPSSISDREKWVDQVWSILQKSYAPIGGIKGSGFSSKEDMIQNIPFWKLYTKNEKVVAAAFYKDKGGRKSVAIATDGSDLGKKIVGDMFKSSLGVSYGEKSGPALSLMIKSVPWDTLENFMLTPVEVSRISGENVIPVEKYGYKKLEEKDKFTYDKFPQLRPYFYVRELGGKMHLKASMGTPNLSIIKK